MGHSGYGEWEKSVQVARDHQNVYLDLTSAYRINGTIDWMVKDVGSRKMVFGTDSYNPRYGMGCVLFSRITDEDRHNIFHRNAERLLQPYIADSIVINRGGKENSRMVYAGY